VDFFDQSKGGRAPGHGALVADDDELEASALESDTGVQRTGQELDQVRVDMVARLGRRRRGRELIAMDERVVAVEEDGGGGAHSGGACWP
jgi:hypothetical protein